MTPDFPSVLYSFSLSIFCPITTVIKNAMQEGKLELENMRGVQDSAHDLPQSKRWALDQCSFSGKAHCSEGKGGMPGLEHRVPWEQKPLLVGSLSKLGDKWLSEGPSSLGIAAALCSLALPLILAHHNLWCILSVVFFKSSWRCLTALSHSFSTAYIFLQ